MSILESQLQSKVSIPLDEPDFIARHIGPNDAEITQMLEAIGLQSLDELIDQTVPKSIRLNHKLNLPLPASEAAALAEIRTLAEQNQVFRSFIGQGYYDTITPGVILRNVLENPGWYTQYTPYQAEISQGRLEALLNFQTMISDLTALPLSNASLLDEGTAAAEALAMCHGLAPARKKVFVDHRCHPQTIAVVRTRAESLGLDCKVVPISNEHVEVTGDVAGVLVQYPTTDGAILDYAELAENIHQAGAMLVVATDLLALTLIAPPGEFGADIAVGCAQRFGVPMGFGGPHAGFMATKTEFARKMPGRIAGVSKDVHGHPALRLTLQTREQHIRREKATSNICTAQVLLAIMASMYAVYYGPDGLKRIARRVHQLTSALAAGLRRLGHDAGDEPFFDTLKVTLNGLPADSVMAAARAAKFNLRDYGDGSVGISCDERTTPAEIEQLIECFAGGATMRIAIDELAGDYHSTIDNRASAILAHPVFNTHHSETEMLRYIFKLQSRDLSLAQAMIPLGSCTMKLNATSEMIPVTWPQFGQMHPFAPADQTRGYAELFKQLENWLAEITGFAAVSLQPNAGSNGEYAGLLAIRGYHFSRGDHQRDVCLIPVSAHGTNPASAVIAGFRVVTVACDMQGNIDFADLEKKAKENAEKLGALMVTYPSTHGVFEEGVDQICELIHQHGGQVYMDGANMNAQVGVCRPGDIGADVCHLNLHKTFCIPHGGGGPGVGPIGVAKHLAPFLPGDPSKADGLLSVGSGAQVGPVASAPFGSASILPISWMYIRMMGEPGLRKATQMAILNANYMAKRLEGHYEQLYKGRNNRVAHEFIVDCHAFQATTGVTVEDIAKRLMDYGFHAPTMSWPEPGTLMIEPTESEPLSELDRLCDALIQIRGEIADIESGKSDRADNALKHAPHTAAAVTRDDWNHKYSRKMAAYPTKTQSDYKFWPFVGRVDNPFGDRNLFCTCPPLK